MSVAVEHTSPIERPNTGHRKVPLRRAGLRTFDQQIDQNFVRIPITVMLFSMLTSTLPFCRLTESCTSTSFLTIANSYPMKCPPVGERIQFAHPITCRHTRIHHLRARSYFSFQSSSFMGQIVCSLELAYILLYEQSGVFLLVI